jgi:hypothetical protein
MSVTIKKQRMFNATKLCFLPYIRFIRIIKMSFSSTSPSRKDFLQWDVKSWSPALQLWEDQMKDEACCCLELGAREGGLSLWLALKGNYVVCTDFENSRSKAEALHRKFFGITNIGNWKLETGNWKLETGNWKRKLEKETGKGNWKRETGNWKQKSKRKPEKEIRNWKQEIGKCRNCGQDCIPGY